MRKVAKKDVVAINVIMLQTIASYVKCFVQIEEKDLQSLQMYADDVAHNTAALHMFNKTKDAMQLHTNIMLQDTLVREFFIKTLRYIEDNKLIAAHDFCCT